MMGENFLNGKRSKWRVLCEEVYVASDAEE